MPDIWESLAPAMTPVSTAVALLVALWASAHAILHKRDVRGAIGWVGVIWLVPFVGALLYAWLGINRIQRRALALRQDTEHPGALYPGALIFEAVQFEGGSSVRPPPFVLGSDRAHLASLIRLGESVTGRPVVGGNHVGPLDNGDEAYPAMLEAIESAERSIALATYIFEHSRIGRRFADALIAAHARGVQVRVLVDDVGVRYSYPPITARLRRGGVRVARFLPAWLPRGLTHFNLRNHRKILVCDGRVAFTGGMNIRQGHVLADPGRRPVADLNFRLMGPVVAELQHVFAEDWAFTTREVLDGEVWFPRLRAAGVVAARVLSDGPDDSLGHLREVFLGALSTAQRSIRIVTPYFLPDEALSTAIVVAAMRGVEVDVVVPQHVNLPVVGWAMWAHFGSVLGHGVRLWQSAPPFDHTKLLVVDGHWALFGSPNWDPRSLRLNFELAVECYDAALGVELEDRVQQRIARSRPLTEDTLRHRSLSLRLRDGTARLLTPYL